MKLKKFSSIGELEAEIEAYEKVTKKTFKTLDSLPPHIVKEKLLSKTDDLPQATNATKTSGKFKSRKNYKELVNEMFFPVGEKKFKAGFMNPLDTWYKEPLYGRVDNKNNLIYHNYWIFTNISDNPANPICVFDFVADAFENMKSIYFSRKLSNSSRFLSDLKAQNGLSSTINLEKKYQQHLEQAYEEFESSVGYNLRLSKRIKNFADFTHEFVRFCINESKIVTFSGFVDSLKSDIYDSYLAFDVLPPTIDGSDKRKIDFLKDNNYFIYEYAARQAGFSIDPNKPWRLIMDLNSKPTIDMMKKKYFQMDSFLETEAYVKKISDSEKYNLSTVDFDKASALLTTSHVKTGFWEWPKKSFPKYNKLEEIIPLIKQKLIKEFGTEGVDWQLTGVKEYKPMFFGPSFVRASIASVTPSDPATVGELQKLLYFIDYFRIELFDNLATFNKFKELVEKYGANGLLNADYVSLMKKAPNPDGGDGSLLDLFAQLFYLIVQELQEKQDLVNFIYDAVKKEKEILKFSNKNVLDVTTDEVYNSVFSSVYDYSYFTYFPLKLDAFYDAYIKKYPYFGSFHKSTNKLSSLFSKNERIPNKLDDIRITKNLQNDFFDEKFLKYYVDLRLKEENKDVSDQVKQLILTEAKEVYSKAVQYYKDTNSEFVDFRNISLKIIEGFIGFPYSKQKPVDVQALKKKATMMAHNVYFNKNLIEPRIQTDRLCCKLPELVDIIAEQDPCPDWSVEDTDVAKPVPKSEPKPEPESEPEPPPKSEPKPEPTGPCKLVEEAKNFTWRVNYGEFRVILLQKYVRPLTIQAKFTGGQGEKTYEDTWFFVKGVVDPGWDGFKLQPAVKIAFWVHAFKDGIISGWYHGSSGQPVETNCYCGFKPASANNDWGTKPDYFADLTPPASGMMKGQPYPHNNVLIEISQMFTKVGVTYFDDPNSSWKGQETGGFKQGHPYYKDYKQAKFVKSSQVPCIKKIEKTFEWTKEDEYTGKVWKK